jgi:hypothetical protein
MIDKINKDQKLYVSDTLIFLVYLKIERFYFLSKYAIVKIENLFM